VTAFQFIPVTPHPLLGPYVSKMFVFESAGRLPSEERKLIVPNAALKLTLTYRNGIVARVDGNTFQQREHELSLTGLIDTPVYLDPSDDRPTGTIVIEFNQLGAYRLFPISFAEVKNKIVPLVDLPDNTVRTLITKLADAAKPDEKLGLLQDYLLQRLQVSAPDPIYDHCINRISYSKGLITIGRLEKETGYSGRWLQRKFAERLGTSAKNLSEIIRFKQFYEAYSKGANPHELGGYMYRFYYDQSHFLRAFKRFTGTTPTELARGANDLSIRNFAI
jgi:AraC-like DNA-binding protein